MLMGLVALFASGVAETIWYADVTKISFLITGIFILVSSKCGLDIFKFEKYKKFHERDIEFGWFVSEVLLALGMTGTVVGFIIIMKDFIHVDMSNISTIETLIKSLGSGVSTALYTTLVGLVGSVMLKIQYYLFEDAVKKSDEKV